MVKFLLGLYLKQYFLVWGHGSVLKFEEEIRSDLKPYLLNTVTGLIGGLEKKKYVKEM